MENTTNYKRVLILDGLRVVAILMVMIYHYYYYFFDICYKYPFKIPEVFKYGYLGVELFFIISGFVITLTLTKCNSFTVFIKKRFIRLVPAMFICSLLSFVFINLFDNANLFEESKSFGNFLLSNTFIHPLIINTLFHLNLNYTDAAYWSLWFEITFYFLAGIIYFISTKHFLRNFSILIFIGIVGNLIFSSSNSIFTFSPIIGRNLSVGLSFLFDFFKFGIWFLIGIVLKHLYDNKKNKSLFFYFLFLFIIQTIWIFNLYTFMFTVITFIILILFIYKPDYLFFLKYNTVSRIGIASYSIYLIHQIVGVILINKLSPFFRDYNWSLPLLIILLMCLFGIFSYENFEKPLGNLLKKLLLKSKKIATF